MYRASLLIFLFGLVACASTPQPSAISSLYTPPVQRPVNETSTFYIQQDWAESAVFVGRLSNEADGNAGGSMMYAGDAGIAGLIAQIAVHAAINSSAKNKQLSAAEAKANRVVEKYSEALTDISHQSLYQRAISSEPNLKYSFAQYLPDTEYKSDDLIVLLDPVFEMTQDERSLSLTMAAKVFRQASPNKLVFEQTVKSIARQIEAESPYDEWLVGEPNKLALTAQRLYGESLVSLIDDLIAKPLDGEAVVIKEKTYRYIYGGRKRYERASLIKETCDRRYLRNLKNNIVVIPKLNKCAKA